MKMIVWLLVVVSLAAGIFYVYQVRSQREIKKLTGAESLGLTELEYADGKKRAHAVREKAKLAESENGEGFLGRPVFIRIFKEERELELWLKSGKSFELFQTYPIAAMSGELGPKLVEGDRQAPEGFYFVKPAQMNPKSRFHLAFNIGYPNAYDRALGRTGSFIMVHGSDVSIGCFAMTDRKIEEIYAFCDAAFREGQADFGVHVFPFRMSAARMEAAKGSKHLAFWRNLKEGYDHFERAHFRPVVTVKGGRYWFSTDR